MAKQLGLEITPTVFRIGAFTLGLIFLIFIQHDFTPKTRSTFIAMDPEYLPHMVLGQRHLAADMLWLRLVQDIDFKSESRREKGWSFQMIDGITRLDPRFRIAYAAGATVLSVLVQDVEGARIIFERAAKQFPSDWSLLYRAGYHYLHEVKDCVRAAELLNQAADSGAPYWVKSLVSRLYQGSGQYEIARTVILDSLERFKGTYLEVRLKKRLEELESHKLSSEKNPLNPLGACQPPKDKKG
jgi:hypothetical protein